MEPIEATPTPVQEWKRSQAQTSVPFKVPSGNTCLVRPVSLNMFLKQGRVPNELMPLVNKTIATGRQPTDEELTATPEMLSAMIDLMDQVVVECVEQPQVQPSGAPDAPRDVNLLYVDEVDLADKAAIFAFATGGVRDVKSFLEESDGDVQALRDVEGVQQPTE
jgi:hypothetical protein